MWPFVSLWAAAPLHESCWNSSKSFLGVVPQINTPLAHINYTAEKNWGCRINPKTFWQTPLGGDYFRNYLLPGRSYTNSFPRIFGRQQPPNQCFFLLLLQNFFFLEMKLSIFLKQVSFWQGNFAIFGIWTHFFLASFLQFWQPSADFSPIDAKPCLGLQCYINNWIFSLRHTKQMKNKTMHPNQS